MVNPLLISDNSGGLPNILIKISGPLAPTLPSIIAPPIHNKKGANMLRSPPVMKLVIIPSSPIGPHPPLSSIHISSAANPPMMKDIRGSQKRGWFCFVLFLTPSSIS